MANSVLVKWPVVRDRPFFRNPDHLVFKIEHICDRIKIIISTNATDITAILVDFFDINSLKLFTSHKMSQKCSWYRYKSFFCCNPIITKSKVTVSFTMRQYLAKLSRLSPGLLRDFHNFLLYRYHSRKTKYCISVLVMQQYLLSIWHSEAYKYSISGSIS